MVFRNQNNNGLPTNLPEVLIVSPQMIIANELGYIENRVLVEIIDVLTTVKKLITRFIAFLNAKAKPNTKN